MKGRRGELGKERKREWIGSTFTLETRTTWEIGTRLAGLKAGRFSSFDTQVEQWPESRLAPFIVVIWRVRV